MLPYKIAITGRFRTGKDTLADILQELIEQEGGEVRRLSFAAALKSEVAIMMFDYLGKAGHEEYLDFERTACSERHLNGLAWQWWGEWRRQHDGSDYWINHPLLQAKYDEAERLSRSIIISDMRHHNEATWCQEHGFYLIRVDGPCRAEGEVRDRNHPSEIHVDELPVDGVVDNSGDIDDLKERVSSYWMRRLHIYAGMATLHFRDEK